ncbi:MAG: hypothetical protein VX089_02380, partial [Pseudomonadota bacterium]|nr:hypothetical protein [Pseudomonadota bacterium]
KEEFVYGLIHAKTQVQIENNKINYELQSKEKGLNKFIRNCPANSSCILVSIKRFYQAGACNVSFVSPDQILFLRLFARGNGIFLNEIVASMPLKPSSIGLSSQIRRSRYESILALIKFCEENNNINSYFKKLAFRRALSRANTYNKFLNKNFFSVYLLMYLVSKFYFPNNYLNWMYLCLKVFTMEGIDKCFAWQTGYEKKMVYRSNFWKY